MQDMREGGWAEELAMDSEPLVLAPTGGGGPPSPLAQHRAQGQDALAPGSEACLQGLQDLTVMSQRHQREQMAEQDAVAAALQPGVRALLMHPGGACRNAFMVPCNGSGPLGPSAPCRNEASSAWPSCAASLAASGPPAEGCPPAWPPPPPPQGHYFGAPPAPPQPSPYYAMPLAAPPQLAPTSGGTFLMYQTAPPGFSPAGGQAAFTPGGLGLPGGYHPAGAPVCYSMVSAAARRAVVCCKCAPCERAMPGLSVWVRCSVPPAQSPARLTPPRLPCPPLPWLAGTAAAPARLLWRWGLAWRLWRWL